MPAQRGEGDPQKDIAAEEKQTNTGSGPADQLPHQMNNLDIELPEDRTGRDPAQGLAVHTQRRKAVSTGLDDPLDTVERRLCCDVPQPHCYRPQGIVDVVHRGWTGNRAVEEVDLDHLDQVFSEVSELQDGEHT